MYIMARKVFKILSYPAVFESDKAGLVDVSFPDFPGCVTFGENFEHAKKMAKEVLELWIEVLESQNKKIPKPAHIKSSIERTKLKSAH